MDRPTYYAATYVAHLLGIDHSSFSRRIKKNPETWGGDAVMVGLNNYTLELYSSERVQEILST